jgi:hypothetical protein
MTTLATRHLGYCQICEGEFKLHEGNMVHHGYRRPGIGNIVGDCYGVGALPYQKSCELVKEFVVVVRNHLSNVTETLDNLKAGLVTELWITPWKSESKLVKKTEKTEYEWSTLIDRRISEKEHAVKSLNREVKRLENRIANWKLTETRTVEEAVEQEQRAKAERETLRNAKRAVRQAKEQATRDKQNALKTKREGIKAGIFAKARELAAANPNTIHVEVEKLRKAMKKATWMWAYDYRECRDELTKIGLMSSEGYLRI